MNKTLLLVPLLVQSGISALAQISVTSSDMPVAGDTIRMSTGMAFTGMDATLTGANYAWDYSKLIPVTQTIDTFISILNTDPVYILLFGYGKNTSNLAERGFTFSAAGVSVTNVFNFYNNTSSRFEQTGFGAYISGVPTATAYSPHDTIYHFPLTYGKVDSSNSGYIFKLSGFFYYGSQSFRRNVVDGWGTLTTPYGTFNVLRVKTTIISNDSLFLDTLGSGYALNALEQIEYKWIGKAKGEPLLQINTSGGVVTQIIYQDSARSNSITGIFTQEELAFGPLVFPNPSTDAQAIVYSLTVAADVKLEVYDLSGNNILTLVNEHQPANKYIYALNLQDAKFSSGIYILNLSVNGKNYYQKLLVTK